MTSISCIMVSYNNGKFIKDAVTSVVNQTMPVNEIIIADDGSSDGSREIITSLATQYSQITPIFREKNLGVADNRDLAIKAAKGDLITTLDSDDLYFPKKIEKEFLALQKNSNQIAYSDFRLIDNQQEKIGFADTSKFALFNTAERVKSIVSWLSPTPRDMLFPKKLYLEVGGFVSSLTSYEDWDFKLRLAASPYYWSYSGIEGLAYRQTGIGLSTMPEVNQYKKQLQVLWFNKQLLQQQLGFCDFWKITGLRAVGSTNLGQLLVQTARKTNSLRVGKIVQSLNV